MYQFLRGIIIEKITEQEGSEKLILDVGGIGYEIQSSLSCLNTMPKKGEITTVYTTLIHKEDLMTLYGFSTLLERELFNLLCNVNGIGPKSALSLLNNLTVSEITFSILYDDTSILCKAQGVGEKTAARIILELKEKIRNWKYLPIAYSEKIRNGETASGRRGEFENEARSVLQSLGYTSSEITQAFTNAKTNGDYKDPESLIQFSLKWLSVAKR